MLDLFYCASFILVFGSTQGHLESYSNELCSEDRVCRPENHPEARLQILTLTYVDPSCCTYTNWRRVTSKARID